MTAKFHYELRVQFAVDEPAKAEQVYNQVHEMIGYVSEGQIISWLSQGQLQLNLNTEHHADGDGITGSQ